MINKRFTFSFIVNIFPKNFWILFTLVCGDAENAGLEKAGLELNGPSRKTGKCRTGIKRTQSTQSYDCPTD